VELRDTLETARMRSPSVRSDLRAEFNDLFMGNG
jgi:hypothetical protein